MGRVLSTNTLDRMVFGSGPCLGAIFLTYTFDAVFFEEQLLAALLSLREDPVEATQRFLDEGRRRLMELPVVVITDPGMISGSKRMPYDLLRANPARTFHPKLALLLFSSGARLVVGSGNLTQGGFGDNAELSALLDLDYTHDSALLHEVLAFIQGCGAVGEGWTRFMAELRPRLSPSEKSGSGSPLLIHTMGEVPLLDAFLSRLPTNAKIHRIGILAPFHQVDGTPPEEAVFDRMLEAVAGKCASGLVFDIGMSWEGNPVGPEGRTPEERQAVQGELWGFLGGGRQKESTSWRTIGKRINRSVLLENGRSPESISIPELSAQSANGRAWPVKTVLAYAPKGLLDRIASRVTLGLWVFPEMHRKLGRTYRQPLHGKLIAITLTENSQWRTHLLLGSPNATGAALLRRDGNVECALHLTIKGQYHIGDLCDELVLVPREQITLRDRIFTVPSPSPARWVVDAVYDAKARQVTIQWLPNAPRLTVIYPIVKNQILFEGIPESQSQFEDFELDPACCELEVQDPTLRTEARVPLRLEHILALPIAGYDEDPSLRELLLLHVGRSCGVGSTSHSGNGKDQSLPNSEALFGSALSPREVFRALLSIGVSLATSPSLGAFQAMLEGPMGVRRLVERLVEAPKQGELTASEAWIYGQELARILERVTVISDPMRANKEALRNELVSWLRKHLTKPDTDSESLAKLRKFYRAVL